MDHLAQAQRILREATVIDTLGGAIVHPTPYVAEGTYEENVLSYGWSAMNACLVSEPSYNATFDEVLNAMYENFLYFEMSPKVKHVETVDDLLAARISLLLHEQELSLSAYQILAVIGDLSVLENPTPEAAP